MQQQKIDRKSREENKVGCLVPLAVKLLPWKNRLEVSFCFAVANFQTLGLKIGLSRSKKGLK